MQGALPFQTGEAPFRRIKSAILAWDSAVATQHQDGLVEHWNFRSPVWLALRLHQFVVLRGQLPSGLSKNAGTVPGYSTSNQRIAESRRKPWYSTIARKMRFRRTTVIGFTLGAREPCELGQACDSAVPSDSIHLTLLGHSQMPLINSVGIPSLPTLAPTIPPTIAAVVSASPPHSMAAVTAF